MNLESLKRIARLTPDEIGAALQGFALRLAPVVAATYAGIEVAREAIKRFIKR